MPSRCSRSHRQVKPSLKDKRTLKSSRSTVGRIGIWSLALIASIATAFAQTGKATPDRTSAIFRAAGAGDLDTLKQLIGNETVDVKMADGATPLFDAAMAGRINVLTWLLDKGANVNTALPDGTTALHLAISNKQLEACKVLVAHKANLTAVIKKPDSSLTPLLLAIDRKAKDIALLLIDINEFRSW